MSPQIAIPILITVTPFALILPSGELAIFMLIGVAGGLYLFVRGFRLLRRKRLIVNTPTSKIRSAAMGLVEVSGLATGPYTLSTPILGKACFLYRTTAWQKSDEGRNKEWEKVAEETLHVPFFLDDNTGKLLVQPQSAELDLHVDFRENYSDTIFSPHANQPVLNFLARHGVRPSNKIRIEECSIQPKSPLFIVGTLDENPGIEVRPFASSVNRKDSLTRGLNGLQRSYSVHQRVIRLSEPVTHAKPANMSQQSKIAAALSKAGITNPAAWEAAGVPYRGATVEVGPYIEEDVVSESTSESPNTESAFDVTPPVALLKGENNPTFVISWRSQKELVRTLAWKSAAMIWGGGVLALLGMYVLLQQL